MKLEALVTRFRTELVSTLAYDYATRLKPEHLEKLVSLVRNIADAARLIGQIHAARPKSDPPPPPAADEDLIDTRPMRPRPPPLPPKR
jgi:hypothetical protein